MNKQISTLESLILNSRKTFSFQKTQIVFHEAKKSLRVK